MIVRAAPGRGPRRARIKAMDRIVDRTPPEAPVSRIGRLGGKVAPAVLLLGAIYLLAQAGRPPQVTVSWETGSEQDLAGFNLYRAAGGDETVAAPTVQVNRVMIPAQGSSVDGGRYRYADDQVRYGGRYRYQIETLDRSGGRERLPEAIAVVVPDQRALLLGEGLAAAVLALFLLRRSRRPPAARS